jgi:hypothetical protein
MSTQQIIDEVVNARDPWQVLGCAHDAYDQIGTCYRRRCLALHPDKTQLPDAPAALQRVMESARSLVEHTSNRAPLPHFDWTSLESVDVLDFFTASVCLRCNRTAATKSGLCASCLQIETSTCSICGKLLGRLAKCDQCAFNAAIAGGRCRKFGCLRPAADNDLCAHCQQRPKKCSRFGCLRPADKHSFCAQHAT